MYALEISRLHKTYANGLQALKGIDLTVEEGDFFALLGPNGAGKSTCIGIITSLVNKTSGTVRVFDHSIDDELIMAKSILGSVPQEFNFNNYEPVQEIITNQGGFYGVPAKVARLKTEHYLKQLGLWQYRNLQAGYLSGGMKRRLMIARALIHKPRLLILDEPTAGVDIELRRSMWEKSLLKSLSSETFIFYLRDDISRPPVLEGFARTTLIDSHTLEVEVPESRSLNDLIQQLDNQQIVVDRMRNKVNRLEELFITITSKLEITHDTLG
jgi:ABC-2 type transport system ATP-binding protein